jgi:MFS transporter, FHS family, L-fucose permease
VKRSRVMVLFVFMGFFVMSLVTNILGPIVPDIIRSFSLSLTAAAVLPFAFFIAYALMSIPAGLLVERYREKPVCMASLALCLGGALAFATWPSYTTAIGSLFVIGAGMAMMQVVLNPLLRVSGGEEHFAFNSEAAQLIFGSASFLSPLIYSYFVRSLAQDQAATPLSGLLGALVPAELAWVSVYWLFVVVAVAMGVVVLLLRFPKFEHTSEERAGSMATHLQLLKKPLVVLYFFSIFAYVGSEQGVTNWMSQFLATYHGVDPQTVGATAVSRFWGLMTLGCVGALVLLKLFDSRRVLMGGAAGCMLCLTAALTGSRDLALIAFPLIGLFISVGWPVIISLALNSVRKDHGAFTGILCTGIAGGAVVPFIVGSVGDLFGLRTGMCILYVSFGWIFAVGLWARPLIVNQTVNWKKLFKSAGA